MLPASWRSGPCHRIQKYNQEQPLGFFIEAHDIGETFLIIIIVINGRLFLATEIASFFHQVAFFIKYKAHLRGVFTRF